MIYRESIIYFKTSNKNTTHNWCHEKPRYGVTRPHIAHAVAHALRWPASK